MKIFLAILCFSSSLWAGSAPSTALDLQLGSWLEPQGLSSTLQILLLLTVLSLAPAILLMTTSFSRILIVLTFLRQSLGTPTLPPNPILIGLALFLTFFTMAPVAEKIYKEGLEPYISGQLSYEKALEYSLDPLKKFMIHETRKEDLKNFFHMSQKPLPESSTEEIPFYIILPSFLISELKTAFQMGFLVYIPFLVIDMLVSAMLMAMGMMMLPPTVVALPLKIVVFVMVDGWSLICSSLVQSFQLL